MTRLRKMMLEELERRNYSPRTIECYIPCGRRFRPLLPSPSRPVGSRAHPRVPSLFVPPAKAGLRTASPNGLAALRFFFVKTLKRPWSVAETPYPKKVQRLPTVLSQEEVAQLINAAPTPFYRILLMTLYATGARRAEVARLKVSDIDSQRMVVHIQGGKGRKDRDVMLSPVLLEALREHWRRLKPKTWLFPGSRCAYGPASHYFQGDLARLPPGGLTRGSPQTCTPAHAAALLCHSSARSGCGPAHHPDAARSPRSGRDHRLPSPFPPPSQRHRQSPGRAWRWRPRGRKTSRPETNK